MSEERRQQVEIPAIEHAELQLTLIGDSPLITHNWDKKTRKEMLDRQMKKATQSRKAKDPDADYKATLYCRPEGGYGFPSSGLKQAAVAACRFAEGMEKKLSYMSGAFYVMDTLTPIEGKPRMREDMVRVGMGKPDIRFRAEFPKWKAHLRIRYNARAVSPEQIINLFNLAGFGVGIGEWRPEKKKGGAFGMFHVATSADKKARRRA